MSKRDYYDVLGVSKDSDSSTIKGAYRKMAMKYHPDRNPGDTEAEKNFKEPHEIKDQGEIADGTGQQKFNYEIVAKGLKTLLTEKLEDDTDGFLIIKRNGGTRFSYKSSH